MTENLNNQFVPYELSLQLKELGFDKPCIKGFYNREELYTVVSNPQDFNHRQSKEELVSSPLWQQAFDWFRIKYNLFCYISLNSYTEPYKLTFIIEKLHSDRQYVEKTYYPYLEDRFDNADYFGCQLKALQKLIEICKKEDLNL